MVHAVNSQGFRLLLRYLTDQASSASAQEDLPDGRSDRSVRPPRPGSGLHFRCGVIRTGPLSNLRTWARAAACPRPRRDSTLGWRAAVVPVIRTSGRFEKRTYSPTGEGPCRCCGQAGTPVSCSPIQRDCHRTSAVVAVVPIQRHNWSSNGPTCVSARRVDGWSK